jgi:hypothetical protein
VGQLDNMSRTPALFLRRLHSFGWCRFTGMGAQGRFSFIGKNR